LKHVLLKQYQTSDEEGNLRSARYAAKLAYRIYGENVSFPNTTKEDFKNTISLARTLRTGDIIIHRVEPKFSDETANLLEILQGKSDKIILLDIVSGKNNERHAEEYLTDIVEEARNFASITDKTVYSCIAGKKRPCMGCLGRMKNVVNKYNQHPGRFWLASIKSQSPQAAKETVKILLNKPSYVTLTRYGKIETSYDSDSATSADSSDDEFFSCNSESES